MRRESGMLRWAMLQMGWAVLLLATVPATLHAHGHLRSATPAVGARLAAPPTRISLSFSEAPELAESTVALLSAAGRPIRLGQLAAAGSMTLAAPIKETLPPGEYRVLWRMVGGDGHPTHGEYRFTVQATAGTSSSAAATGASPAHGAGLHARTGAETFGAQNGAASGHLPGHDTGMAASSPPFVALRFLMYLSLIALIGAVAFRLLVLSRLGSRRRGSAAADLEADAAVAAARIGTLAAGLLLAIQLLRLPAQSAALHGAAALDPARLGTLLGSTHWGATWLLQSVAAAAALVGLWLAARGRQSGWLLAALAALGLALGVALGGHALVSSMPVLAVVADALHITGASGWLGSLVATMAAGVVVALRGPAHERAPGVAALVEAFSPTALLFASLTAATGVFAAWLQLGHLPALTGTDYGRVFLLKLGLVAGLGLVGAYNWLRVKPALGTDAATSRLRRSAAVELTIGVLVVLVTAILVGLPTPVGM